MNVDLNSEFDRIAIRLRRIADDHQGTLNSIGQLRLRQAAECLQALQTHLEKQS